MIDPEFKINGLSWRDWCNANPGEVSDFIILWSSEPEVISVYTSGSTGEPKKIDLPRKVMIHSAKNTALALDLKKGMTALLCMPVAYIAGKMMLVRAMVLGLDLTFTQPRVERIMELEGPFDFTAMTPYQLFNIWQKNANWIHGLRTVLIGGGALNEPLRSQLLQYEGRFFESYGMTETASHIALKRIVDDCFTALPGVQFFTDERQCLKIQAPDYSPTELQTNDVVDLLSPKCFVWRGRADFVINSGGVKIHPEEVERQLQPLIDKPFFISSIPHESLGDQVVLLVETQRDLEIDLSDLTSYQRPKQVFFVPEFSYTASGKIDRLTTVSSL